MMMLSISMQQGKAPDQKSDKYHTDLKIYVVKNIDAEQWQCAYKKRQ